MEVHQNSVSVCQKEQSFTHHLHVIRSWCTFISYQLTFWKYEHFHESEKLRQNSFTNDWHKKWVLLVFHELGPIYTHTHTHTHTQTHIYIYIHTLSGHFIRYTLLVPGCLQNCLNSSWHRFNKVLETFLRDFGSYWYDSITQLLQICRLHIHDVNLPFHHIP